MNIYVFKTNINQRDVRLVNSILRSVIPHSKWNFDLEDCDNILRIESRKDIAELVYYHLQTEGFICKKLE